MADQNQYSDTSQRIRSHGGSLKVALSSDLSHADGANGGTALPCGGCYVQAAIANTEVVKMNIDAAASANLGVELARQHINDDDNGYGAGACQPLWVPIDDVNKLYFYSSDTDAIVDITYFT